MGSSCPRRDGWPVALSPGCTVTPAPRAHRWSCSTHAGSSCPARSHRCTETTVGTAGGQCSPSSIDGEQHACILPPPTSSRDAWGCNKKKSKCLLRFLPQGANSSPSQQNLAQAERKVPQIWKHGAVFKRDRESSSGCPPFAALHLGGSSGRSSRDVWSFTAPLLPWKLLIFSHRIKAG